MSITVNPSDDTSYAETQGWGLIHVPVPDGYPPLQRIVFYVNGKNDGEYAYICRVPQGDYHVSPDGTYPWSRGIALPQTARTRAEWISKRMRECEEGLVHFSETLREIKEYMLTDGGV